MIFTLLFSTLFLSFEPASPSREFVAGHYKFTFEAYTLDPKDCCSVALEEFGKPPNVIRITGWYKGEDMCVSRSAQALLYDVKSVRYKAGPTSFKLIFEQGETDSHETAVFTFRNGELNHVLQTSAEFPKEHRTEIIYTNLAPPES